MNSGSAYVYALEPGGIAFDIAALRAAVAASLAGLGPGDDGFDELASVLIFLDETLARLSEGENDTALVLLESAMGKLKDAAQKGIDCASYPVVLLFIGLEAFVEAEILASGASPSAIADALLELQVGIGYRDRGIARFDAGDCVGAFDAFKAAADKWKSALQKVMP